MWMGLLLAGPAVADETRDRFDGFGRLVAHQVLDGDQVREDVAITWDGDGNMLTRTTSAGGHHTVEEWSYDRDGHGIAHHVHLDGALIRAEATTWEGGLKRRLVVTEAVPAPSPPAPELQPTPLEGDPPSEVSPTHPPAPQLPAMVERRSTTVWVYDDQDREITLTVTAADGPIIETRTSYDRYGQVATVETLVDGHRTSLVTQERARSIVPLMISVGGGVAYQTDVDLLSVNGNIAFSRKPSFEQYGADPLEFLASASYQFGRSRGEVVTNALNAHFSLDLNLLAPRTTPFMFIDVDRNPAFNQNIDLELAPIGVKLELVPRHIMKLDFSFAPLLNYRSIFIPGDAGGACGGEAVTVDTDCSTLKIRGSFRLRLGYEGQGWEISDAVEYLPNFNPQEVSFAEGLSADSITRNTFSFSFAFTPWLKLSEGFVFTRDPSLSAQADCAADPDLLLCDGMVLQNVTSLNFVFQVKR